MLQKTNLTTNNEYSINSSHSKQTQHEYHEQPSKYATETSIIEESSNSDSNINNNMTINQVCMCVCMYTRGYDEPYVQSKHRYHRGRRPQHTRNCQPQQAQEYSKAPGDMYHDPYMANRYYRCYRSPEPKHTMVIDTMFSTAGHQRGSLWPIDTIKPQGQSTQCSSTSRSSTAGHRVCVCAEPYIWPINTTEVNGQSTQCVIHTRYTKQSSGDRPSKSFLPPPEQRISTDAFLAVPCNTQGNTQGATFFKPIFSTKTESTNA